MSDARRLRARAGHALGVPRRRARPTPSAPRSRRASAESAEWRAELAEVRAARDAVRRLPAREAPAGFWDAVLAHGRGRRRRQRARRGRGADRADRRRAAPRRRLAWIAAAAAIVVGLVAVIAVPHRSEVSPNVTAVVAQHGAQGSDAGDPVSMLAPVGPLAGFRR